MTLKEALDEKYSKKADAVGIFTSDKDERGFAEVKITNQEFLDKCIQAIAKNEGGGKMFVVDSVSEAKQPEVKDCSSISVKIYMAGDYDVARKVINDYCFERGLCVNLVRNTYIYSAGEETGFIVELINYPRFPKSAQLLKDEALILANKLRMSLNQDSFTIQCFESCCDEADRTKFYSWRHLRNK